MRFRSQTATEYLIILAVVIVIALIVVGVLGGVPSIGGGASTNAEKARLRALPVGISPFAVTTAGVIFGLINNQDQTIIIQNISIDGEQLFLHEKTYPITLDSGMQLSTRASPLLAGGVDGTLQMAITYKEVSSGATFVQDETINYQVPSGTYFMSEVISYSPFENDLNDSLGELVITDYGNLDNTIIGKFGSGLWLQNNDSNVTYASSDVYDMFIEDKTLSFWTISNDFPHCGNVIGFLRSNWGGYNEDCLGTTASAVFFVGTNSNGAATIGVGMPSGGSGTYGTTNSTNWVHVVLVQDGGTFRMYQNGIQVGSTTGNFFNVDQPLIIGNQRYDGSAERPSFHGYIDELTFWNRSLTATEVQSLYDFGK